MEVRVYPNPVGGQVTVEVPVAWKQESEWVLYNGVGQQVLSQKIVKGAAKLEVDLSGISVGLYYWAMRGDDGQVGSGKLVVSR